MSETLDELYETRAQGGWTDDDLMAFLDAARTKEALEDYASRIVDAVRQPAMPDEEHSGDRFFEALAWYTDMTTSRRRDGKFTQSELQRALDVGVERYLQLALTRAKPEEEAAQANARRQCWKNLQKLQMLARQIQARPTDKHEEPYYPYRPMEMMAIDHDDPWNRAHTIDTPAEFEARVKEASHDKPVLVKFGLTYCMHCLLLEQLGSVPAVAKRYGDAIDVYKLWWNPKDPAMKAISDVARAAGVTSSPYFIVYRDGGAIRRGYAFPDEMGMGLESLLAGIAAPPA